MKRRITLQMSIIDAVVALGEGNPGAVVAMSALMKASPVVDPDAAMGALTPLLALDERGIYGPRIWMLYKDVCDHDTAKVLAILRAYQLGQLEGCYGTAINHAIDNNGNGLDLNAIMAAVQKRLPRFNRVNDEQQEQQNERGRQSW